MKSFSDLLGVSRKAVSIMTISELKSNLDKYTYPGIYGIYCMVEGKFYIGGSLVLQERLKSHFFTDYPDIELQKGSNKPLQRAIKRHGMDKFQVIIFHEFSHVSHIDILMFLLGEYEQWFLSNVNQRRLYNIRLKSNFLGPISNLEPDHSIHQLKPDNTIKMYESSSTSLRRRVPPRGTLG